MSEGNNKMSADFANKKEEIETEEVKDIEVKSATELAIERTKVLIELKKQIELINTLDIPIEEANLLVQSYVRSAETPEDFAQKEKEARKAVFQAINEISRLKNDEDDEEKNAFDHNRFCKIYESACFLLGFLSNKRELLSDERQDMLIRFESFISAKSVEEAIFEFSYRNDWDETSFLTKTISFANQLKGLTVSILNDKELSDSFFIIEESEE
tara:strand:- start:5245 stop:5886 length:642 start_codon:yes stop_codon:yes gene_type:complete